MKIKSTKIVGTPNRKKFILLQDVVNYGYASNHYIQSETIYRYYKKIVLQIVYKKKATNCVGLDYEFEIKLNILVYLHGLLAFRYALMKKPNRPKKKSWVEKFYNLI